MKEIKLTEKDYSDIKSNSIDNWVKYGKGDNAIVISVIDAFIGYCNRKGYVVKDGKVILKDEEEQKSNS